MSAIAPVKVWTAEEFLALPDNGTHRELIRGELREWPMTTRNPSHGGAEANIATLLNLWKATLPPPRGKVLAGEVRVRIRRNPDTIVGIDVIYIDAELAARTPRTAQFVDGPPTLGVEILSPSNTIEDVLAKVQDFLDAGIALVWVVEPVFRTVTVYRPDRNPELFNIDQELTGEPHLPGLRIRVADIFT